MSEPDAQRDESELGSTAGLPTLPASAAGQHERLTITDVELFCVCPPLKPGILAGDAAADFDAVPKYILKVHTDAGIVGLGETHRMAGGPDSEAAERLRQAAKLVCGTDVLDYNMSRLELPVQTDLGAFEAAFELETMGRDNSLSGAAEVCDRLEALLGQLSTELGAL